jgi:hypothetical protein
MAQVASATGPVFFGAALTLFDWIVMLIIFKGITMHPSWMVTVAENWRIFGNFDLKEG